MTELPQNPDVIVVGAGAAGLAAGCALQRAGLTPLVLEAAGHVGGRCVTDLSTFSVPFDRGGSWLHSATRNPLAQIAEAEGWALHRAEWRWSHVHVAGHTLTAQQLEAYRAEQDQMWHAAYAGGGQGPDVSVAATLPQGTWRDTAIHAFAQMNAGDADQTSAADHARYDDAGVDWLVEGGLGAFVAALHREVPVALNCPVTQIDTSGPGVSVSTPRGTVRADHVILTVSTGVLASGRIAFTPELPLAKREAVQDLPNGLLNKVGFEFDPGWRAAAQGDMADYHPGGNAFCSLLFGFYDSPLAVGFLAGRFADEIEAEGAGAATDFCLQGLRAVFGSDVTKYIRKTDETAWRGDPLTAGSYSYAKVGRADARAILAQPLANRLFFAGEATIPESYSTVHGAYQSGQRAAAQVIEAATGQHSKGAAHG